MGYAFLINLVKGWRGYAAVALVVAGLLAAWYIHGQIYQKGYSACENAHMAAAVKETEAAVTDKGKSDAKYKVMPITDVDRVGSKRGWVRQPEDR